MNGGKVSKVYPDNISQCQKYQICEKDLTSHSLMRSIFGLRVSSMLYLRRELAQWPLIDAQKLELELTTTNDSINKSVTTSGNYKYFIKNAAFENTTLNNHGGSVRFSSPLKYDVFLNNSVFRNSSGQYGGSLYIDYVRYGSFDNLTFQNCYASNEGGAIYSASQAMNSINNSYFINCSSLGDGGSIRSNAEAYRIESSFFYNSSSIKGNGGSLYLYNSFSVLDCQFITCFSYVKGGAIYIGDSNGQILNLIDLVFYNCCSIQQGGAIYFENGALIQMSRICFQNCQVLSSTIQGNCCYLKLHSAYSTYLISLEFMSVVACGKTGYGNGLLYLYNGEHIIINNNYSMCYGYSNSVFCNSPRLSNNIQYSTISKCLSTQTGSPCIYIQTLTGSHFSSISFCNIIENSAPLSIFHMINYGPQAIFQYMVFKGNNGTQYGCIYANSNYISVLNSVSFGNIGGTATVNGALGHYNYVSFHAITTSNAPTYTLTFYSTIYCETFELQMPLEEPCQTIPSFIYPPTPTQCKIYSENNPLLSLNIGSVIHAINPFTYLIFFD